MKVGDVVKLVANYRMKNFNFGVIIRVDQGPEPHDRWCAYHVQWDSESLWHGDHELEIVSESR